MKKILALLVLLSFITSCGPKRLGCGPRSCMIEMPKEALFSNQNVA